MSEIEDNILTSPTGRIMNRNERICDSYAILLEILLRRIIKHETKKPLFISLMKEVDSRMCSMKITFSKEDL